MASNMRRAPAIVPMNGMAGAGVAVGVMSLAIAVLLGFAFVPFAVVAVMFGVFAVILSARGRTVARTSRRESRLATVGLAAGGLAMVLGLLGVVLR